jgi:anti-sigma regulatory factor (Ser/Thr protein kinase)
MGILKMKSKIVKEHSFPCNLKYVRESKNALIEFLDEITQKHNISFDETLKFYLMLVVDEATVNAIDHGSACKTKFNFNLKFVYENSKILIFITDFGGKKFNPEFFERLSVKKTWGIGGRGIQIISQLMDEVTYLFQENKSTTLIINYDLKKEHSI